jgi:RNA polymerase sigma factor (sigma-70 family)
MEASALRYSGAAGLAGRAPLLRLQSDERLVAITRRGNHAAFEVLVSRYQARLLAFCRHLLGSREDAEDVIQEVMAAAFNSLLADDRPINVRPWLYRIARNRSLNHLRRAQTVGVDSMDIHFSEHGTSTADKVQQREQFRLLIGDIQSLPETQRTALILREMEALSYEQIAEAMETTVPGVKSLLVRARISLAEAAEARQLTCADVRLELGEVAEGLRKKPDALVRRHLKTCTRCSSFQGQLKSTSKALGILLPIGPLALLKRLIAGHIAGHSASSSSGAVGASGASGAAGTGAGGAAVGGMASGGAASVGTVGSAGALSGLAGSAGSVGIFSAGAGALATKAAAGVAAAMLVTAGAVEVTHVVHHAPAAATGHRHHALAAVVGADVRVPATTAADVQPAAKAAHKHHAKPTVAKPTTTNALHPVKTKTGATGQHQLGTATSLHRTPTKHHTATQPPGRTQSQTSTTVLPAWTPTTGSSTSTAPASSTGSTGTATKSGGTAGHRSSHHHRGVKTHRSTTAAAQ